MSTLDPAISNGRRLSLEGYRGEVAPGLEVGDMAAKVLALIDPESGGKTLHWGRNFLFTGELAMPGGPLAVVVKQFRNQGFKARWRRRTGGSKAEKSWRAAQAVLAVGVPTAKPVLLLESRQPDGPSFFISERIDDVFEARYLFRAIGSGRVAELFPQVDTDLFFDALGTTLRRLHDAGIWHRDISIGNLLVRIPEEEGVEPEVFLIDLNRARLGVRMRVFRRTRDLCRLPILRPRDRDRFLRAYWSERTAGLGFKRALLAFDQRAFLLRNWSKSAFRAPFKWLGGLFFQRRAYDHIPTAQEGAGSRDKAVWDRLSDQPHQHATRSERLKIRLADAGTHASAAIAAVRSAPAIWSRYRRIRGALYGQPVPWSGVGVAVRPRPEDPEQLLDAIVGLGVRNILLRLHPWQDDHDAEEGLARDLHERGYDLAFALPQDRDLVRDRGRWTAAVETLAERFTPFGSRFQVGQAINRSKWGVWNYREYLDLASSAIEILRRWPGVEIMGPGVIDFEYHATAAVLNMNAPGVDLDIVSSLLYVDRRGAPENRQLGFDTVDKVALLKAVAETARNCDAEGRCWVTEVNWPLWEGPHSPAGRSVSVDEESQADYLVRYYLLALGTGLLERVYWWQLAARGYGLMDPEDAGGLRPRPSYLALATLHSQLAGATFVSPRDLPPPARLYRFETASGEDLHVAWAERDEARIELPRPVASAFDRSGQALDWSGRSEVRVTSSPVYLRFEVP